MKVKHKLLLLVLVLAVGGTASAQIITNVVRANGASAGDPLATEAGGLIDGNLVFSDRDYVWAATDTGTLGLANEPLIGSEYIRTFNDDKNSGGSGVSYTVTTSTMAAVWITVDDRVGDQQAHADTVTTLIGPAGTFTDTGLQLHVGGDGDAPGRPLSVFAAELAPGDHVFGPSQGNNFYVIGAVMSDPTFNPAPSVNAGPDQGGYLADTFQLDGSVVDFGSADGTSSIGGVASFVWAQESGPGTATFSATDVLGPTVTFEVAGTYELFLTATDLDAKDANDAMIVLVLEPQLVRHWSMDVDPNDEGNGALVGGAFIDTTDAAVGTGSVNLMGTGPTDPNMPRIEVGAATDLDFGLTNWTVAGWVKTTHTGTGDANKGVIFGNGGDSGGGHRYTLIVSEGSEGRVDLVADDDSNKNTARTDGTVNDGIWHFIVGLREGNEIRIYRDGLLEDTEGLPDVYDLSGTSQHDSYIGVITHHGNSGLYKHLYGSVDDVRIYNYAISQEQIEGLAGMGELPPVVDAGGDIVVQLKPGEKITLAGLAEDYGIAGPLGILWTTESDLSVADAIFTDATSAVTEVEFPAFGIYVLTLSADDGTSVVSDSIQIEVVSPTCADVITEGLLLVGDISGPDGTPDCRVNLFDVAEIAAAWMTCNDPSDVNCAFPY